MGRKALIQPGLFVGSFSFRGEGGYTKASAKRAKGLSIHSFREVCRGPDAGPESANPPEVTLLASRSDAQQEVAFRASARAARGGRIKEFEAVMTEHFPDLTVERVAVGGGGDDTNPFIFDVGAGTANVMPSTPFHGSASLSPSGSWSGDLSVSFLGAGEVGLAGPGFKANLGSKRGGLSSP